MPQEGVANSDDVLVAKVNDGAALTAVSPGQATITVTPFEGASGIPLVVTVQ